jgi:hypothetical protein
MLVGREQMMSMRADFSRAKHLPNQRTFLDCVVELIKSPKNARTDRMGGWGVSAGANDLNGVQGSVWGRAKKSFE